MKNFEIWDELGRTYYKAGLLPKAVDAYNKAIEQETQSGWTFSDLAAIYVQQGRLLDSIPLYQKSLELFVNQNDQAVTWGRLGNVYHKLNEYGKAIQAYQKADDYEELSVSETNNNSAKNSLKSEDEYEYDHFITSLPSDLGWQDLPENEESLEENLITLGQFPTIRSSVSVDSESDLIKVCFATEENANVWNELGLVLFKVGSYDDAIDAFNRAIELEPEFGFFYSNLGQVFITQGRLEQAVDLFEKSISFFINDKDKANSWSRLGDIYRQLGRIDEMTASFRLAEALNQSVFVATSEYCQLNLESIVTNVRRKIEQKDINDLVVSIQIYGIIQPLIVCPSKTEPGKYEMIAGRRRLEAARYIGIKSVPAIIRPATELEKIELSINENIHTASINPFELAHSYRQLANEFDLSVEDISARVGRSVLSVANTMKVLEFSDASKPVFSNNKHNKELDAEESMLYQKEKQTSTGSSEKLIGFPVFASNDYIQHQEKTDMAADVICEDPTPILWYLEQENEYSMPAPDNNVYNGNTSLMTRARQMLKTNPHSKRIWASPA